MVSFGSVPQTDHACESNPRPHSYNLNRLNRHQASWIEETPSVGAPIPRSPSQFFRGASGVPWKRCQGTSSSAARGQGLGVVPGLEAGRRRRDEPDFGGKPFGRRETMADWGALIVSRAPAQRWRGVPGHR